MYLDYKKRNRHVDIEKLVRDCRPQLSSRGLWPEPVDRQDSRHPFPHTGFRSLVPENFPSRDLPGALRAGHPGPVDKKAGRRPFSILHPEPLNTGSLGPESSLVPDPRPGTRTRVSTAGRFLTTCLDYSVPVRIFRQPKNINYGKFN
jgi:hypothetical protein